VTRVVDYPPFREPYAQIVAGKNTVLQAAVNIAVNELETERTKAERISGELADGWMALPVTAARDTWMIVWRYDEDKDMLDLRALVPWPPDVPMPTAYSRGD
jgi:hypothetical protein